MLKYKKKFSVGIVGTGYIANVHAEILKNIECVNLAACCDISSNRVKSFARKWNIPKFYTSVSDLLKYQNLDVVHILVPPPHHYDIGKICLLNGVNIFLEKPMCLSCKECKDLNKLALENKLKIGVNHNAIYHPAFLRLKIDLNKKRIGNIKRVIIYQTGPLGQLTAEKFSHWMFQSPENIIFEQAPHPISQIRNLLGELTAIKASAYGKKELTLGQYFYDCWQAIIECEKGIGFIHLSFGDKYYPQNWVHVTGQDGSIFIDLYKNLYLIQEKSIFPDYFDSTANAFKYSPCVFQGIKNFVNYALSKLKFKSRSDPFFVSMKNSIESFYNAFLSNKDLPVSGEDGLKVIEFCENWIKAAQPDKNPSRKTIVFKKNIKPKILITGANGFIGTYLVDKLVKNGISVRVLVRSDSGLKPVLYSSLVERFIGDLTNKDTIFDAVKGMKYVFHLAHGGGEFWEDFYNINVLATKRIAEACLQFQVKYLLFTSTIAVYGYIDFKKGSWITENDPIDSKPQKRNFYARSKILAENILLEMFRKEKLPVVIFRPAIVLGKGGTVYHGGVGDWIRDNVCFYWGSGKNPLPYILAEDVASALVNALNVENLQGEIFNLSGDICFSAREYIDYLRKFSKRDIKAFPFPILLLYLSDAFKYLIKVSTGQRKNAILSYRDLYNRSIPVRFDCRKAKSYLSWQPCNNFQEFLYKAIAWAFEEK